MRGDIVDEKIFWWTALFGYFAGLVLIGLTIVGIRGTEKWPAVSMFVGAGLLGAVANWIHKDLSGGLFAANSIVLYIAVPVLFGFCVYLFTVYTVEAWKDSITITILGQKGLSASKHQWDFMGLFFFLAFLSLVLSLWLGSTSITQCFALLPDPSVVMGKKAVQEIVELAQNVDSKRPEKPLQAQDSPFAITLYPDDFEDKDLKDPIAKMIDEKIKDLNIKVKKFIHVKYRENRDHSMAVIAYYETETLDPLVTVSSGMETMITRVTATTEGNVNAWAATNVLPYVELLSDFVDRKPVPASTTKPKTTRVFTSFPIFPAVHSIPAGKI